MSLHLVLEEFSQINQQFQIQFRIVHSLENWSNALHLCISLHEFSTNCKSTLKQSDTMLMASVRSESLLRENLFMYSKDKVLIRELARVTILNKVGHHMMLLRTSCISEKHPVRLQSVKASQSWHTIPSQEFLLKKVGQLLSLHRQAKMSHLQNPQLSTWCKDEWVSASEKYRVAGKEGRRGWTLSDNEALLVDGAPSPELGHDGVDALGQLAAPSGGLQHEGGGLLRRPALPIHSKHLPNLLAQAQNPDSLTRIIILPYMEPPKASI